MSRVKKLTDVVRGVPCEIKGNSEVEIKGIAYHSADVKPGYLFVAIEGFKVSGREFIDDAIHRGAVAVATVDVREVKKGWVTAIGTKFPRRFLAQVANRFYDFPARKLSLIGVTGTNGKTTTCFMIRSVCQQLGFEPGFIGTIEHFDGQERKPASQTTPESLDFVRMLSRMVENGVPVCVAEVSSHSLELDRVFDLDFRVGVFTNFTQDHLDFHRTMENYKKAKMKLFEGLAPNAFAVVNFDDRVGREIPYLTRAKVISYGTMPEVEPRPDISGVITALYPAGSRCEVRIDGKTIPVEIKIPGRHNLLNLLATFGVAKAMGWEPEVVAEGVSKLDRVPGRLEAVPNRLGFSVFVDYAHTPDALQRVLETAREWTKGKIIVVFGCGGDRDRGKRPLMGKVAVQRADIVVVTSDNPRSEDPKQIIAEILQGIGTPGSNVIVEVDREEAIRQALQRAQSGDTVIIAGKGHEDYQIVGGEKSHFDDREVVRRVLREME
ncbi:UDP-N-acetylmuramoyl-L-alanyl-D-glutamate--2,6-diaminopimelate ligase [candidate division WOR-3 bacterium]|nr:UDP-N-acetylmuramoyl-L-alanyl-D-glutamate--2,6-diaminopimelate ligase [candidate division WOR-3 bacterium]